MFCRFNYLVGRKRSDLGAAAGRARLLLLVLVHVAATLTLLVLAGCHNERPLVKVSSAEFVGSAACADCHAKEFSLHSATHHAATMRTVDKASMGAFWPQAQEIQDTNLEIYNSAAGASMGFAGQPNTAQSMDFALGSDRFAFTYLHFLDARSILELRSSFYPASHSWLSTPSQENMPPELLGRQYNENIARHCLGCHSVALPTNTIRPEPRFFGVGCESCHGPGQKHIAAMSSGKTGDIQMADLGAIGGAKLNELCGKCHRNAGDVPEDELDNTQRFEPYGLTKSRCFIESGGKLSCLTCHDPHKNSSTDTKGYEKVCLKCHTPTVSYGPVANAEKACPVNPRSGCIPCHMPKRPIDQEKPIVMADHYIRVITKESRPVKIYH